MSPIEINLRPLSPRSATENSDRIVASPSGRHFFTFRPDWTGPSPLPFRAAAATLELSGKAAPRVLILGFGMGAMGAMMRQLRPRAEIIGVEPDDRLHRAAREALHGIENQRQTESSSGDQHPSQPRTRPAPSIRLHKTDAISYLRGGDGLFDLILDDCFVEVMDEDGESEPYRPPELEVVPKLAKSRLTAGGLYARNLLDQEDLTLDQQRIEILHHFAALRTRTFRDWDNVLAVATDSALDQELVTQLGS